MYSDQFAPGFAGLMFALPLVLAGLIALFIFRRPIITFVMKVYFSLRGESVRTLDETRATIERERAAHLPEQQQQNRKKERE
jgi:hypothetical protein